MCGFLDEAGWEKTSNLFLFTVPALTMLALSILSEALFSCLIHCWEAIAYAVAAVLTGRLWVVLVCLRCP